MAWSLLSGCFLLLVGSCGYAAPDFDASSPPQVSDAELAIIDNWKDCSFCVVLIKTEAHETVYNPRRDGLAKRIKLQPGRYEFWAEFSSYKGTGAKIDQFIDFQAGHTYVIRSSDCYWGCSSPYPNWLWIEDTSSQKVVAGTPRY